MTPYLIIGGLVLAFIGSLVASTLTYSLRDFSRARLADALERRKKSDLLDPIVDHSGDLVFLTAFFRLLLNIVILIAVLSLIQLRDAEHSLQPGIDAALNLEQPADTEDGRLVDHDGVLSLPLEYLLAVLITAAITLFCSVAIPNALAKHAGENVIASFSRMLLGMRIVFLPVTKIMHAIDNIVRKASGANGKEEKEDIEQEILSAVEEGEKEGVVDEQEREMIESVIHFRNIQVGQIMTARPEIFGLESTASLKEVKDAIEESGHSRLPVYEGNLDHIIGILYARDLLKDLGQPPEKFDIRKAMRPPFYVPETKPLRDLLRDFRLQKVHIAIVLDEYGGTAGLVTIEDLLEELVGEISDEHEPAEPAMLSRIDDLTYDADARIYIDELNRTIGLNLPEDAGYDTLGGFVSTTLGKIPEVGTTFQLQGARFTILESEPQKVNRVKVELLPQPAEAPMGK